MPGWGRGAELGPVLDRAGARLGPRRGIIAAAGEFSPVWLKGTRSPRPGPRARRGHARRQKLAESARPVLLDETGLPTRYYLPREDVRTDLLRPTDSHTTCPFKGEACYWSADVGGEQHDDLVWSYESPIPQAAEIAGLTVLLPGPGPADRGRRTALTCPARPGARNAVHLWSPVTTNAPR